MKRAIFILAAASVLVVAILLWTNERKHNSGTIRVSHRVTLAWSASKSRDVTSYRIYISRTSGGPYTLLSSVSATSPHVFVDTTLASGQTYFFVITAVNFLGKESSYSNQGTAVIPNP